jgi:hypothetical protein
MKKPATWQMAISATTKVQSNAAIIGGMDDDREVPDVLWKYREWKEHAKNMVVHSELYFSRLEQLNDPLDCHWCERLPTDYRERFQFIKHLSAQTFPDDDPYQRVVHMATLISQLRDLTKNTADGLIRTVATYNSGVLCLSEINNDFLMWSHYADHHKGICIGIRPHVLRKRFLSCRYGDDAPVIDAWDYVKNSKGLFVNAVRCKASHWSYEKEWRTADAPGAKRYPGCIDSVVLGVRISDEHKNEVLAAIAESQHIIKVFQARLHPTKYQLLIEPAPGA